MARDRVNAARGGGGGYGYSEPSYPTQQQSVPYGDGGRGYNSPRDDPRDRGYGDAPSNSYNNGAADDMSGFYAEIGSLQDELRAFNDNVARIGDLHSRSLNNMDEAAMQRIESQLDGLVEDTRALSGQLKKRIKALESRRGTGRDGQIRQQQTGLVKAKFVEAIQNYQDVEKQYRQKYKARMERQYKIVKPDASPEEIRAAVNDEQGGQVFAQALMSSNRYGESKAAYREVQERHKDIQKIERTITELAQLFNDMSVLVEKDDETLAVIEANATNVAVDTEAGWKHTEEAKDSAAAARRKRWICFWIIVVILIIVAIVVAVVVTQQVNQARLAKAAVTGNGQ